MSPLPQTPIAWQLKNFLFVFNTYMKNFVLNLPTPMNKWPFITIANDLLLPSIPLATLSCYFVVISKLLDLQTNLTITIWVPSKYWKGVDDLLISLTFPHHYPIFTLSSMSTSSNLAIRHQPLKVARLLRFLMFVFNTIILLQSSKRFLTFASWDNTLNTSSNGKTSILLKIPGYHSQTFHVLLMNF